MPERRFAPPMLRPAHCPQGAAKTLQRAQIPGGSGASSEFRQSAHRLNDEADGSQAAQLKVVVLDMRGPVRTHKFERQHVYYPQTGQHSEARLMDAAILWISGLHVPATSLRLTQVQLYTRFNPCPQCADRIVAFRGQLLQRARNGTRPPFHLVYTYKTYFGPGGTWPLAEGMFQRQAASTKVRMGGWIVTDGLGTQSPVLTADTLGTAQDPITLD